DEQTLEKIREIGKLLGLAFQIKDDLLDYSTTSIIGKPALNDLKEHKITLPLLYALQQVNKKEQKSIIKIVHKRNNTKDLPKIISFIEAHKGFTYAEQKIEHMCTQAQKLILTFEKSDAQNALLDLISYISDRKK
ncbi:MAG: polyprenyl synthetase family protein, partial [Bacteroidales bacterium]